MISVASGDIVMKLNSRLQGTYQHYDSLLENRKNNVEK